MTTARPLVPDRPGRPDGAGRERSGPGPSGTGGSPGPDGPSGAADETGGLARRGRSWLDRHPAWPVTALVLGYPVWWVLGLADFMWIVLAVPMAARMVAWRAHGSRRIRVPPAFGLWLLFLVCTVAGIAVLSLTAPGTVASPVSHRFLSYANRTAGYLGVTVLLLYAGNLTERELPRRWLAWMLGFAAIYTVIGGLAGMVMPSFQFSSPFLLMLPHSVQANPFIQASMHPGLSQVQNVLGSPAGRPKAPYDYTNTWGNCLTILVPWLLVAWWRSGRWQRLIAAAAIAISLIPLLYSLNRAAWVGAGLSVGYVALRLAAKGRLAVLGGLCALIALAGILILATPLQHIVTGRLSKGGSVNLRSNLDALSLRDALSSPVIGYGDTRQERGSPTSIAIGPSPQCPVCGQLEAGSTGQLWLLLVCSGFPGAICYLGFFACGAWFYRRDGTGYGIAGVIVLLLGFVYMFTYDATGAPLGFTMMAYVLLWKNEPFVASGGTRIRPGGPRALAGRLATSPVTAGARQ